MKFSHYLAAGLCFLAYASAQQQQQQQTGEENVGGVSQYPTYDSVPAGLSFSCQSRGPGYYADPEAGCQVWHWCLPSGAKYSFLCPNGTLFNQRVRVCDWWFNVDCPDAPNNYNINDDLYKDFEGNPILG